MSARLYEVKLDERHSEQEKKEGSQGLVIWFFGQSSLYKVRLEERHSQRKERGAPRTGPLVLPKGGRIRQVGLNTDEPEGGAQSVHKPHGRQSTGSVPDSTRTTHTSCISFEPSKALSFGYPRATVSIVIWYSCSSVRRNCEIGQS